MTEAEMYLVGDLLYSCGRQLAAFDERSSDKRLLIVTTEAPTIARYVIASPMTSTVQKALAEESLREFMRADASVSVVQQTPFEDNDLVMYCAPDIGLLVDTLSPGPCCDSIYHAADSPGDLKRARCTRRATTRIRVTVSDGAYVAKVCARCAEDGVKTAGMEGSPLTVEILGDVK